MNYIELIQKAIDYIDENIQEEIFIDTLAKIASFSTYHFYRVFSSFVGLSVMEYVTKRKLQLDDMYKLVVPTATYAVFTTPSVDSDKT